MGEVETVMVPNWGESKDGGLFFLKSRGYTTLATIHAKTGTVTMVEVWWPDRKVIGVKPGTTLDEAKTMVEIDLAKIRHRFQMRVAT